MIMDYCLFSPAEDQEHIAKLEQWKKEAMEVFNDLNLQEIGEELGLPLGSNIAARILPAIKGLKQQLDDVREVLDEYAESEKPAVHSLDAIDLIVHREKQRPT